MKVCISRMLLILLFLAAASSELLAQTEIKLLGVDELLSQPEPPADFRLSYGDNALQYADLRIPDGDGPHPIVVLIHGGCWKAEYNSGHLAAMAQAITEAGMATWTIEFRRIGDENGAWPETFNDVSKAIDWLPNIAAEHELDLDRVVLAGHSAGGHLALWAAARHKLAADSPLYVENPLPLKGVIGLAPAADLELTYRNQTCSGTSQLLIGGTPEEFPQRYHDGSAAALLPLGVPQLIINGDQDGGWLTVSKAYKEKARLQGEDVELIVPVNAGHFELVMPVSSAFPIVLESIETMLQ